MELVEYLAECTELVFQKTIVAAAANDTSRRLYIPSPFSTPAPLESQAASNACLICSTCYSMHRKPSVKHCKYIYPCMLDLYSYVHSYIHDWYNFLWGER